MNRRVFRGDSNTSAVVDAKKQPTTRLAAEQMRRDIKRAEMRVLYSRTALILAALGLFITGAI